MILANPGLAWLLAAALLVAVPLVWNRQMLTRRARAISTGLRAAALVLVALAMMEPAMVGGRKARDPIESTGSSTVCVVDCSASIRREELERALLAVRNQIETAPAPPELLLFAREVRRASRADLDSLKGSAPLDWLKGMGALDRGEESRGTALERALRAAADLPVRSILLYSDGNETSGSAEKTLPVLAARGLKLTAVPLEPLEPDSLAIAGMSLPQTVLDGKEFQGQVSIRSQAAGSVKLRIKRGEHELEDESVRVEPGLTNVTFADKLTRASLQVYTATVTPEGKLPDKRFEDDRACAVTQVLRVPKVLAVSSSPGRLAKLLTAAGLEHEECAPKGLSAPELDLPGFSAVILDNIDSSDVPSEKQKLLATFVSEQGGGLLAIGGEHGFGAGGWVDTEIEKILPVNSTPKGYDRSLGLIVLLDSSGSMAGFPIEYARKAVKEIIGLMRGRWLGVVNFSHVPEVSVSFQVIGSDSYVVRQDIDAIQATGGTLFYQPMAMALNILNKVQLDQKHILMLSDGEAADFFMVRSLYEQLDRAQIKVSTMAFGRYVNNSSLEEIADSTGGRFYSGQDFSKLPELFRQEVRRISGPPVVETSFVPARAKSQHPLERALPKGELPRLYGYDATSAKPRAEVLLTAPQGEPILATWRVGVGKSAAFTSDFSAGWGRDWVTWPQAPRFFGAVLGEVARLDSSDYRVTAAASGAQGHVVVDAVDQTGRYLNFQRLIGRVTDPRGKTTTVALRQSGAGRYETWFPMEEEGGYRAQVFRQHDGAETRVGEAAAALSSLPEYRPNGVNRGLLERLASATGGKIVDTKAPPDETTPASAPAGDPLAREGATPLWPVAALLALALLLIEIVCRRLGKFSAVAGPAEAESGEAESAGAFQKIAEKYLRLARDLDAREEHAKAAEAYLKARSFFLKAKKNDEARMMWDRYRLLEDRRSKGS
ncbi:MAG: VWA domain-containing protein [Candidatus Wallbacteria bacterium]|nr:VWA domain-containing protein [Candidatus Wallbacteria bacterium]